MKTFKYIEVQKSRDLGQILNASFSFISQNFVNLGKSLLYIGGLPLLIALLYSVFIQWDVSFQAGLSGEVDWAHFFFIFSGSLAFHLIAYIFIAIVPIIYMRIYIEKKSNDISVEEVWNYSSGLFLKVFFAQLGVAIITGIAFIFFIIPGIFVAVAFSLVSIIIVVEEIGFSEAIGRSSRLISEYWWFTFAVIFVISIIQGALSFILQAPLIVLTVAIPFITDNVEMLTESFWLFRVLTGISELSSFFYAFYSIALTFHYYSLVEKKEATGLLNKIEALNDTTPPDGSEH